jgi:hypothetical protein
MTKQCAKVRSEKERLAKKGFKCSGVIASLFLQNRQFAKPEKDS